MAARWPFDIEVSIRATQKITFIGAGVLVLAWLALCFLALSIPMPADGASVAKGEPSSQHVRPVAPPACSQIRASKWNHLVRLEIKIDRFSAHRLRDRPVCVSLYKPFKRHVQSLIRTYCHYAGTKGVKCWIRRAAAKYNQPLSDAMRVADCESDFRPWLVNSTPVGSEHATGLFQFLPSTWRTTPYRNRSIFSARWNAMAAMWMWSVGRRGEWACR